MNGEFDEIGEFGYLFDDCPLCDCDECIECTCDDCPCEICAL